MKNPGNSFLALLALLLALVVAAPLAAQPLEVQQGAASYYGPKLHGRKTASGERMDQETLIAAHPSWPFGTVARVTNLKNGRSTQVRIVDRGPARKARRRGVVIDLSTRAARVLEFLKQGKTQVRVEVLRWGDR
ncbi:MAG: septal ring lytic transglycosylase RlpA family protein [Candidatus Competibacteraceae bacterium]|nr:septal ring lytic transglycosylase RlpA family protein [Candidatus Competibacteraceae bacterium]